MYLDITFIDLFCGIGGFRIGFEQACAKHGLTPKCLFSSDIDSHCQTAYEANFGERPHGDITEVAVSDIPPHEVLLAGFPCQAFSIAGKMRGFEDTRGTLFFDVARILHARRPRMFILENVKQLVGHDKGKTLSVILETLRGLGYTVHYRVLNALDYGLPQKRERVFIVGFLASTSPFVFPEPEGAYMPLSELLESEVPARFWASGPIRERRHAAHQAKHRPAIWHENKSGHISSYPYSCALRAGASYNYLLVDGERRLMPRELLRLQGFPDTYQIAVAEAQVRKQAGNAVPVRLVAAVAIAALGHL